MSDTCGDGEFSYLKAFDARYVLNGTFGASVTLTNQEGEYTVSCDGPCDPVRISLDADTSFPCCESPPDNEELVNCLEAPSPYWVNGIATSFEESFQEVDEVSLTVVSYFNHLGDKPLATQQFPTTPLSSVITVVSDFYGGVPVGLRNYNIVDTYIRGPVLGSSLIEELRLLAQAGQSHLFVQVGGILTIEPWKDHTDLPELTIPQEMVFNIQRAPYSAPNVNFIKIRGAELPQSSAGFLVFTDSRIANDSGGLSGTPGAVTKTSISGVPTPTIRSSFENLAGTEEDLKSAEYVSDETSLVEIPETEKGSLLSVFKKNNGSFFGPSPTVYRSLFYGTRKDDAEYVNANQNLPLLQAQQQQSVNTFSAFFRDRFGGYPVPWGTFGNSFGSNYSPNTNAAFSTDQPEFSTIETYALSPQISNCGSRSEEIQNRYILSKELLFKLAVRRFQEMKLEANTWNIEVPYLPCLRLNQVISVEIPKKYGLSQRTVTGIIAGLDVSFDAEEPNATMRLALWDTSCLGDDLYISGNLIPFPYGGEDAKIGNPYVTSALGLDGAAGIDGGVGWLYALNGSGFFRLIQTDMTPGDMYTLSFSYEMFGGPNSFRVSGPIIGGSFSGSGVFSETFTPLSATEIFEWNLVGNSFFTYFRVFNISLIKTVVA